MFPPSLVGYYRGDFKPCNAKLIDTEDAMKVFFQIFPFIQPDDLPKINFEARQIVVVSASGPELLGLFSIEETAEKRCNIIVKRILQNENIKGSASMLLFSFSKNYKLNVVFKPPVQLTKLEPFVEIIERKINALASVYNSSPSIDLECMEMMDKSDSEIIFYEKQKALYIWKAINRYCGRSLEEYDSFQHFRLPDNSDPDEF